MDIKKLYASRKEIIQKCREKKLDEYVPLSLGWARSQKAFKDAIMGSIGVLLEKNCLDVSLLSGLTLDELALAYSQVQYLPDDLTVNDLSLLGAKKIRTLPAGLKVKKLCLMKTRIKELPADLEVENELLLCDSDVKSLPHSFHLKKGESPGLSGTLDLTGTPIRKLTGRLIIEGNLEMACSHVEELPEGMIVYGCIFASQSSLKHLPNNLTAGWLDISYTDITELPENLHVHNGLIISHTRIRRLPESLETGGIDAVETPLEYIPQKFAGKVYFGETKKA